MISEREIDGMKCKDDQGGLNARVKTSAYLAKTLFVAFFSLTNRWQFGYVQGAQLASSQEVPMSS